MYNERFATSGVYCMAVWVVVGDMVDHEELAACSAECQVSYGVIQTSLSVGVGNGKQEDVENPRKHV